MIGDATSCVSPTSPCMSPIRCAKGLHHARTHWNHHSSWQPNFYKGVFNLMLSTPVYIYMICIRLTILVHERPSSNELGSWNSAIRQAVVADAPRCATHCNSWFHLQEIWALRCLLCKICLWIYVPLLNPRPLIEKVWLVWDEGQIKLHTLLLI